MTQTAKLRPLDFESAAFAPKYYDSHTEGPRVVLLHGTFGSTASHFGLVFQGLARDFRVVGLDFQEPESDDLQVEELVSQVRSLVEGLGGDSVHLLGYSLGAVVAAAFAGTYSALVDRLVLLAGWQHTDSHLVLRNDVWQALRKQEDDSALRAFSTLSAISPEFIASMNSRQLKATMGSMRFTEFGDKQMGLNRRIDIRDEVARISAPTLVLSCNHDVMIPPHHQRELATSISDARFVELQGGHGIVFEDPDAISDEVRKFLS